MNERTPNIIAEVGFAIKVNHPPKPIVIQLVMFRFSLDIPSKPINTRRYDSKTRLL